MKIVFLDVDGPLIPLRMYFLGELYNNKPYKLYDTEGGWVYDPVAVLMIQNLCTTYGAKLVYNSSHNDLGEDYIFEQAVNNNFGLDLHRHFMTEYPRSTYSREDGINKWLVSHPEVTNWVSVDDYELNLPNFVKIDFNIGISLDNYRAMEGFLK